MYLSKIALNTNHWAARRDLGNPYEMHRSILRAFPDQLENEARILFRLENLCDPYAGMQPEVLVQSTLAPNWGRLLEQEDYLADEALVKEIQSLGLRKGEFLRFRLRANPSKRDGKSHKRVGIYKEKERVAWLERKAEQGGFKIDEQTLQIVDLKLKRFFRKRSEIGDEENDSDETAIVVNKNDTKKGTKNQRITLNMVDFEGYLQVMEPDMLFETIQRGVGPAKGFGCGLLSIARA